MNGKKERIKHTMELLRNFLERCGHKKIDKPKDDLFGSQIGSQMRGGGIK